MENKISANDERRLTGAIEKAASLAATDETRDRNALLAACLLERDVPVRFAKVASAAFNKRLTVLTFQKTADDHKADDFQLADADTVFGLVGGQAAGQRKTASVRTAAFSMEMGEARVLRKVAAASAHGKPLYEDRIGPELMARHLESMMQKHAAAHSRLIGELHMLGGRLQEEKDELNEGLRKLSSFDAAQLVGAHPGLEDVRGVNVPAAPRYATVDPGTRLSKLAAAVIRDSEEYTALNDAIADYQEGLEKFASAAAEYGREMHKKAIDAGMLIRGLSAATATVLQAAETVRGASQDAFRTGMSNAKALLDAGTDVSATPSRVLDSDFLVRDRLRDRLLGWSDMSADPMFSMYPSEQVFLTTQKVMDMDPTLESPSRRELLRAQVGQLLAQNGRAGMADIAALATALRGFGSAGLSDTQQALESAMTLAKKDRPEAPSLTAFTLPRSDKKTDYMAMAAEGNKADKAEADAREKERKDSERSDREAAKDAYEKFKKDYNVHVHNDASGNPDGFDVDGEKRTLEQTAELFEKYRQQLASING